MGAFRRKNVGLIDSKGCSKLFPVLQSPPPVTRMSQSDGPFSSLVICVSGLSKDARKQVKEATERLGGEYSPHLHVGCTHLVIQSSCGRKFDHTLKHGARNGLFVVTIAWFVDSVKRNLRMSESLYNVKQLEQNCKKVDELSQDCDLAPICRPRQIQAVNFGTSKKNNHVSSSGTDSGSSGDITLADHIMYLDPDISDELRLKVLKVAGEQGAKVIDSWFIGCNASLVVCESASIEKYLGHAKTIVSSLWVLKTAERHRQRLVHMSPDLARQLGLMLENFEDDATEKKAIWESSNSQEAPKIRSKSKEERKETVSKAKTGVRRRRARHMQTCQNPIRRITQTSLLENICWTISEAPSTATIFTDSCSSSGNTSEPQPSVVKDGLDPVASFSNSTRALTESEKTEMIFKDSFLTILYPADRFSEMGPSSRTYFSENGFTCMQILDYIHRFYQENLPDHEIEIAIHTDSKHADNLRSLYSSKDTSDEEGCIVFPRIQLLGSRKSFEMLKRVNGENNSCVYELMIRA